MQSSSNALYLSLKFLCFILSIIGPLATFSLFYSFFSSGNSSKPAMLYDPVADNTVLSTSILLTIYILSSSYLTYGFLAGFLVFFLIVSFLDEF